MHVYIKKQQNSCQYETYMTLITILSTLLFWSIVNAIASPPSDVRIDHYKVETTRDLIVNTPRPTFSWKISSIDNQSQRNIKQIGYQIQLQSVVLTDQDEQFVWDSKRVISSQSIHVEYTNENNLLPSKYYDFRLRIWTSQSDQSSEWTEWIRFRTPVFNLHKYLTENSAALWIGSTDINMNELRKEFIIPDTSPLKSAIVYLSGVGYYQFYLNGNNVDPTQKLDPAWTPYEKRTLFVSFDLTSNLTIGKNAVGIKLGNGWYSREQDAKIVAGPPRLLFTLLITFENGHQMEVVSDETWQGREGSIKHDSIYNGEIYDSRTDRLNWSQPDFNDSLTTWIKPQILSSPVNSSVNGTFSLQDMPPIRAGPDALHFEVQSESIAEIKGAKLNDGGILKPIDMWISDVAVLTFDLGQNMAGWCRLKFNGVRGYGVYIRHAEILSQPSIPMNFSTGHIYTDNLRQATASDTYILHGDTNGEIYEPKFTYHGFRYLAIWNPPSQMSLDDVECLFVHSETTQIGHFVSSNPVVNQIQHNIQWTQLSNIMSVPTDCAQRNERRGWMADAALTVDEALYNFDLIKFYHNYLNLIVDLQQGDGAVPDYVPGHHYPADINWGTALPTITWQVYRHYQDIQTLRDYYDPIASYISYYVGVYKRTGLANYPVKHGDWVPPPPHNMTNIHLVASYALLHDVYLFINMSRIVGNSNNTEKYSSLYEQLTEEFHRVFYNTSSNVYADGLQSAQVFALSLAGVVPDNLRKGIVDYLANDIRKEDIHVTTGMISTAELYPVLSNNGYHDLAIELISSTSYPSYGYMFTNPYENATTIWELWSAPFTHPHMNSRNQAMYASVGAWFYSHLAGIDLSSDVITIRPRMVSESKKHLMSKLDCQLSTLYGLIRVSYTRDEQKTILLRLRIPPNVRARVIFEPLFANGECKTLIEDDKMIWSSDVGISKDERFLIEKDEMTNMISVYIGSGDYEFGALWT